MKRILLSLTMIGFLFSLTARAQAEPEVSLDFFYDNLSDQGSWIEVGDYGYCFQPNVAVSNTDWRPYADGYWAYTDDGWTWVSYEDFGWATYHYGRWADLDDYGWVWVPGYEWGPAWVSWRTGGDYIGWAPLPPAVPRIYEGRAITGQVDLNFDIGPLYYNFVDIRYIGEPVLRQRIIPPRENITIINRTVNVTNITYNNSTVYNYGPNFDRVNRYSTRPIQRLNLQRETTLPGDFRQGGNRQNFNRVNGNQLMVVAPPIRKAQQTIAPKHVKVKVESPKIERGWRNVPNRQQLQAEMKKENAKQVPPPTFTPGNPGRRKGDPGHQPQSSTSERPNPEPKKESPEGQQRGGPDRKQQPKTDSVADGAAASRRQNDREENAPQRKRQNQERRAQGTEQNDRPQAATRDRRPETPAVRDLKASSDNASKPKSEPRNAGGPDRQAAQRAAADQNDQQAEQKNQNQRRGQPRAEREQNPKQKHAAQPQQPREQPRQPQARPQKERPQPQPQARPQKEQRPQARPQPPKHPQVQEGDQNPNKRKNKKKKPNDDQPPAS